MRGKRIGVNVQPTSLLNLNHSAGRKVSPETRKKISEVQIGRKHSESSKKTRSRKLKGKPWSQARRDAHNRAKAILSGEINHSDVNF